MALGLLGIAKGAFTVGQKIFAGVKKRKEAKIEKRANSLADAKIKLEKASAFFTPGIVQSGGGGGGFFQSLINPEAGLQSISSAANNLAAMKSDIQPVSGAAQQSGESGGDGKINPMFLLLGGVVILFLFLKKR